jgi:hypothetical protein
LSTMWATTVALCSELVVSTALGLIERLRM